MTVRVGDLGVDQTIRMNFEEGEYRILDMAKAGLGLVS
jgi:hypothetical protein